MCAFGNVFYSHFLLRERVVIDLGEHYPKQTARNRYDILGAHGLLHLTIPVKGQKGQKIPMDQMEIDNRNNWRALHWKTIQAAYGSAPWFEHYAPELQPLYHREYRQLIEFNLAAFKLVNQWLNWPAQVQFEEKYVRADANHLDLRTYFKPVHFRRLQFHTPEYIQVFSDRHGFSPNSSVLDLVFNLGPQTLDYLKSCRFDERQIASLR